MVCGFVAQDVRLVLSRVNRVVGRAQCVNRTTPRIHTAKQDFASDSPIQKDCTAARHSETFKHSFALWVFVGDKVTTMNYIHGCQHGKHEGLNVPKLYWEVHPKSPNK